MSNEIQELISSWAISCPESGERVEGLGQINVITGVNGSGKTRFLNHLDEGGGFFRLDKLILMLDKSLSEDGLYVTDVANQMYNPLRTNQSADEANTWVSQQQLLEANVVRSLASYGGDISNSKYRYLINVIVKKPTFLSKNRILDTACSLRVLPGEPASGVTSLLFSARNSKNFEFKKAHFALSEELARVVPEYVFDCEVHGESGRLHAEETAFSKNFEAGNAGDGVQQVVYMISRILESKSPVVLLDEPELHLHPALQVKFAEFLKRQTDKVFLSPPTLMYSCVLSFVITFCWLLPRKLVPQ